MIIAPWVHVWHSQWWLKCARQIIILKIAGPVQLMFVLIFRCASSLRDQKQPSHRKKQGLRAQLEGIQDIDSTLFIAIFSSFVDGGIERN